MTHLRKASLIFMFWLGFRVLVRSRPFWVRGLSNAWHSRDGVSDELVDAYRLPQLVRGWEIGLVRFIRARVAGKQAHTWLLPHVVIPQSDCPALSSATS